MAMDAPHSTNRGTGRESFSLFWLLATTGREKNIIAWALFIALAAGLAIAFALPPLYTSRTVVLPSVPTNSMTGVAASLGALAASAGVPSSQRSNEELYTGLLKTESIASALEERFKLRDRYAKERSVDARKLLAVRTRVTSDRKSSLISIEVQDRDPTVASQLANAYVEELRVLLAGLALTEAQRRRQFFEQQVNRAKESLGKSELAIKHAQESYGLQSIDSQTQASIETAVQLRVQIVTREAQLQAVRAYAGPDNSELKRLIAELSAVKNQLNKLEGRTQSPQPSTAGTSDPRKALEGVRLYRELKYHEAVYAGMLQQLQLATVDEARDAPLLQQVDVAIPADRKSWPSRTRIVLIAIFIGLIAGVLVALLRNFSRDPDVRHRLGALIDAWSFRT